MYVGAELPLVCLLRPEWVWDGILENGHWANEGRTGHKRPAVEWTVRQWKSLERVTASLTGGTLSNIHEAMCWVSSSSERQRNDRGRITFEEKWWLMNLDASQAMSKD